MSPSGRPKGEFRRAPPEGAPFRLRRWRRSIRLRLVALFLLLALCIAAVFLFGLQRALSGGWQGYARPLLADYADRLSAEIGSPPDLVRAQAIVQRLPVTIRIDGPVLQWESHPRSRWQRDEDDDEAERFGLVRRTADGHHIRFGLGPAATERPRWAGWLTLAALLALTALAYHVVRRWLAPLDAIGAGAERYGRGDFGSPIAVRHDDELGDLARRIDRMAAGLYGMLEAKRTLLLAISHELRSPLTRARLNAELLPDSAERDAMVRDLGLMRDLVADLLEGERLVTGHAALQAEPTDLAALVREVLADRPAEAEIDATVGAVRADPARIRLLLRNLLDNALRHAGGAPPPRVFLHQGADGTLVLGVRDFGPGVDPAELPRLAEAFYRPDGARTRAAGGVGLGLHLCRLVAQAHGGTLELRNAQPGLEVAMHWRPQAA
jgi:signal transduction histidine kinase